jgi:tetratricopeptide (TPR) repeat protein
MTELPEPDANGLLSTRLRQAAEAIILTMGCVAPWAYGAVDAWAQMFLAVALVVLAILGFILGLNVPRGRLLLCLPSIALGGLCVLGFLQARPLEPDVLKKIAPASYALVTSLAPDMPVKVKSADLSAVAPPALTLSQNPEATLHAAVQLTAAWVLFQTVMAIGGGFPALRKFGLATTANAAAVAFFAIVQSLTWSGKIYGIRPSPVKDGWNTGGPFVGHSHLAAYLNLGLGFALCLLLFAAKGEPEPKARKDRGPSAWGPGPWIAFAAGFLIVGILASHSRNGFLSMLISGVVTFLIFRPKGARPGMGLLVLLVLVPVFLLAVGAESALQRVGSIASEADESGFGRAPIWASVLRAAKDYPLCGVGVGAFSYAMLPYNSVDNQRFYSHAENEYLHYLAEGGFLGLAFVLLCLIGFMRLGWKAIKAAQTTEDRGIAVGAMFAMLSLALESLGDFALHIPGVAVTAIIIGAYVCRLGLDGAQKADASTPTAPARVRPFSSLAALGMIGLSVFVFKDLYMVSKAEAAAESNGLHAGSGIIVDFDRLLSVDDLKKRRTALEWALKYYRPDWAEGHTWLALTDLALYQRYEADLIEAESEDPEREKEKEKEKETGKEATPTSGERPKAKAKSSRPRRRTAADRGEQKFVNLDINLPENEDELTDPIWLHAVVHNSTPEQLKAVGNILEHEQVKLFLLPAARSFLEARRVCPVMATSHAYLGGFDYLLEDGESTSVHARRALRLAGSVSFVVWLAGRVAYQAGDLDLCAQCWQRLLEIRKHGWEVIADAAIMVYSPQEILDKVLPPGAKYPTIFADRLFLDLDGYEVMLLPSVTSRDELPEQGFSRIVVASVHGTLCIRVFERDGNLLVDTDESQLPEKAKDFEKFKETLKEEELWAPHRLTKGETNRVINTVSSLVGLTDSESESSRDLFLRATLARVADDPTLSAAEKLWWTGEAKAGLGEIDEASVLMEKALAMDPKHGEWWETYVYRLIQWGEPDKARKQGLLGTYHCPNHRPLRIATDIAAVARARGDHANIKQTR